MPPGTGSGTVTATAGALTSNSVVLGAGTTDTKVIAGIITDGISALTLGVAGASVGAVAFHNITSGAITVAPAAGALGAVTLTLPAATDTLVGKATTDTLTNKTLTSPTLTTPALGTPTALVLTNATGLPVAGGGTGVATLTAYAPVFGGTTSTAAVQSGTVGTTGQVLTSNGAGVLPTFQAVGGGTAGGADTQIQFNNAGAFAGDADLTWNSTTNILTTGSTGTPTTIIGTQGAATAIGAALSVKGGAGGATSGDGGVLSIIGGASTTTGAGGALNVTGGAAAGTGAAATKSGGAIVIAGGRPQSAA